MKKWLRVIVVVAVLAVTAYFVYNGIQSKKKQEKEEQQKIEQAKNEADTDAAVPVKVTPVVRGDLPLRLTISAVSDARRRASVRSEVEGIVAEVLKREGERVQKGEIVIRLESAERLLALKDAEASRLHAYSKYLTQYKDITQSTQVDAQLRSELEKQKKDYDNALILFREGKIDKLELEKREAKFLEKMIEGGALQDEVQRGVSNLATAEVALERARLNLERSAIRAPFSGIISEVKLSPGERISAMAEAFRLVDLDSVYLKGYVLETELGKIKPGQGVRIRFLSYPGQPLRGKVATVAPEVNVEKKTGTVFIEFANPGTVFTGMEAEADIEYEIVHGVLKVPVQSIMVSSNRPLIFIVRDETAMWEYITTGARNDEEVAVEAQPNHKVEEGEEVVIEGQLTLAHQAKVRVNR